MESALDDDDDITLLRQSARILQELGTAFIHVEDVANDRDLENIIRKVEPYQEDPQLLDPELGRFIPLLSDKFTRNLQHQPVLQKLSRILYTFCKVRGEKVIVNLLNNEPRWIEPLLAVFAVDQSLPWEESYILLVWLSYLMLSPFDLATISSFASTNSYFDAELIDGVPGIANQVMEIGMRRLKAATIERKAAASLLVRLCIRQDMLNIGLLGIVTRWAISEFEKAATESHIHDCLGTLTFLSKLVASGDQKMLGPHLGAIFGLGVKILEDEALKDIRDSVTARKLVIKILRNTAVHCLQAEQSELDATEIVEQVIGACIELLADSDTSVRMAASKSLSLITLKLGSDMAGEVVEALNASFRQELIEDDAMTFWSVNAQRWHGIVLTLGHLLHRRAVATDQVPDVLKSILYALNFEQRSTTGRSVGANVRDAANYGLWAIARRCSTTELESVSAGSFSIHGEPGTRSSIQYIACNLLVSACFDPDGNVRRGSSAALQEIIGRHPNTVVNGIDLVQVVDYQAVGLRSRATTTVAHAASRIHQLYESTLISALWSWRGLAAASSINRSDSAIFAGLLIAHSRPADSKLEDSDNNLRETLNKVEVLFSQIRMKLSKLRARDYEERHGLILAASWLLSAVTSRLTSFVPLTPGNSSILETFRGFLLKNDPFLMPELGYVLSDDFQPRSPRADLVISATLRLLGQLAGCLQLIHALNPNMDFVWNAPKHVSLLDKCLARSDDVVLDQVPLTIKLSIPMLLPNDAEILVQQWLTDLAPENKKPGQSADARILAMGAAFSEIPASSAESDTDIHETMLRYLLQRYIHVETESRIVVLRSLKSLLQRVAHCYFPATCQARYFTIIITILLLALHDYTISERGDVGSLVRMAGLSALQEGWSHGLLRHQNDLEKLDKAHDNIYEIYLDSLKLHDYTTGAPLVAHIQASVLRLSLEKLDRVRYAAVECWNAQKFRPDEQKRDLPTHEQLQLANTMVDRDTLYLLDKGAPLPPKQPLNYDISSTVYFQNLLTQIPQTHISELTKLRILEGFCSTAGGAGSGASQNLLNARKALHLLLADPISKDTNASAFGYMLKKLIDINTKLENDHRLVSILEVVGFVLDIGFLRFHDMPSTDIEHVSRSATVQSRAFYTSIQKSHFKSKNIMKLQICLDVYRGLATISEIRGEVVRKVVSMLLHPIPAVRTSAAETLAVICVVPEVADLLGKEDWTRPAKELKQKVDNVRKGLGVI